MTDNRILATIRESRRASKLFNRLSDEDKRRFLESVKGLEGHLIELLADFVEAKK